MKPDVSRFLEVVVGYLMTKTAPALDTGYDQSTLMVGGVLLLAVRHEFERAAARRVEENDALRRLFADAAPTVQDIELRKRLEEAAAGQDASLLIANLERGNTDLRGLLIDLHAHIEALDSPQARHIEDGIWQELSASTERRSLPMLDLR